MKYLKKFESKKYIFKIGDIVTPIDVNSISSGIKEYLECTAGEIIYLFGSKNHETYRIKFWCDLVPSELKYTIIHLISDDEKYFIVNFSNNQIRLSTEEEKEKYLITKN